MNDIWLILMVFYERYMVNINSSLLMVYGRQISYLFCMQSFYYLFIFWMECFLHHKCLKKIVTPLMKTFLAKGKFCHDFFLNLLTTFTFECTYSLLFVYEKEKHFTFLASMHY